MKTGKFAVVGAGSISQLHMQSYAKAPGAQLYAVCDINEERAKAAAEKFSIPHVFTSYDEMYKMAEIDGVSICTWNNVHAPAAIAALKAGKNVLCEKPMALNAGLAQEMLDTAKANNKLLAIGFVRRFGDNTKALKTFIDNGDLGNIYFAKVKMIRRWGNPGGWFSDKSRSGGGALIDLGVHIIDLAYYLGGRPNPVSAYATQFCELGMKPNIVGVDKYYSADYKEFSDVEDGMAGMVRFDNGMCLSVEVTWVENAKEEIEVVLYGDKAGARMEPEMEIFEDRYNYLTSVAPKLRTQGVNFDAIFQNEINHFVDCVMNNTECMIPAQDGLNVMKVLDSMYASAQSGHEVIIK